MKRTTLLVATTLALGACGETSTQPGALAEVEAVPVAANQTSDDARLNRCYGEIISGIASTWPYAVDKESFPPPPGALAKWIEEFLEGEATARDVQELFCD